MKKLNLQQYAAAAAQLHDNKYTYDDMDDKYVRYTCPQHGQVRQLRNTHMQGAGCPPCGLIKSSASKKMTTEKWITKAKKVHGDRYGYEKVVYTSHKARVVITCHAHGDFTQVAKNHIDGYGCTTCGYAKLRESNRAEADSWTRKANELHHGKYGYANVVYINSKTKVDIMCPLHGVFSQIPYEHGNGGGCAQCAGNAQPSTVQWVAQATVVHGNKYDYSNVVYRGNKKKVSINCPTHGQFSQTPNSHTQGAGCPGCSGVAVPTTAQWVDRARSVHGDRYVYDNTVYTNDRSEVIIMCPKHGEFQQIANSHVSGKACRKCSNAGTSKPEQEMAAFIASHVVVQPNSKFTWGRPDVYTPSLKIAFEMNGEYWHSDVQIMQRPSYTKKMAQMHHATRYQRAKEDGIRLIQIWGTEWEHKRKQCESLILSALGLGTKEKVYARKCTIEKLAHSDIKDFYNEHHIQGAGGTSPHHYALTYEGKIVAAMSFKKPGVRGAAAKNIKDGQWELDRYATSIQVPGGASRLLSHFVNTAKPQSIVSYSDNMLFTGGMYEALGFTNVGVSPPDYKLFFPQATRLRHKSAMQRKHIEDIRQKLDPNNRVPAFDADKSKDPRTEFEMEDLLRVKRVWGAGITKWEKQYTSTDAELTVQCHPLSTN